MHKSLSLFLVCALSGAMPQAAIAQQDRAPPVETYKMMVEANRATGWVAFRNFNGRQLVYFTPLVTMHCGLSQIRYSINTPTLDQTFPLPECHPALPFSLPPDAGPEAILLDLDPGTAEKVAVQVVYADQSESAVMVYEPCVGVGEQTCAFELK